MLTAERLRQLVRYDPATGIFTNIAPRKKVRVGVVAGNVDSSSGYRLMCVDRSRHYAHRLAFLYMTGSLPAHMVDHLNGDRSDNRWSNLRDAPRVINQQNMRGPMTGTASGLLGAFKKRNRWESRIRINGRVMRLGTFGTAQAAHEAYVSAKRLHHPGCTL